MLCVVLLRYNLDRKRLGLSSGNVNRFYRKLYGYHSCSYYGKYHHWVNGFLDEINGKKVSNSSILIPDINLTQLKEYLEDYGATVEIISDKLFIDDAEFPKIKSMGKKVQTPK